MNALRKLLYKVAGFCCDLDMTSCKPQLKEYLDIHQYLEELYKYRKATESGFSYETWSQELGLNHRSYLRQIVIGRRSLSPAIVKLLIQRLNLQGQDREYFETLVLYSKAGSSEQRNLYGKRLNQLIRTDVQQASVNDEGKFVLDPLLPRLHTLLSFIDAPKDEKSISTTLRQSPEKISLAIQSLIEMDLVQKDAEAGLRTLHSSFKIPDQLGNPNLLKYHEDSLKDAILATQLEVDQRRFKSLLVAMNKAEFQEFLEDLQIFVKQTLAKFNPSSVEGRQLFQINMNLHSVSEFVAQKESI